MNDFMRDTMLEKLQPISNNILKIEFGNGVIDAIEYLYAIDALLSYSCEIANRTDGAKLLQSINMLKLDIENGLHCLIDENKDKMNIDKIAK